MNETSPIPAGVGDANGASEERALWTALKKSGSQSAREQLVAVHMSFVRSIARRHFREQSRGDLELAELYQLAYTGLLEAIDRFDPEYGAPFRPFAAHRISGSILDGIASSSEMREQISWARRVRLRRERLQSLAHDSGQGEAPSACGAIGGDRCRIGFGLHARRHTDDDGRGRGVSSAAGETAYESVAWSDTISRLRAELRRLPSREQAILRQHYISGMTFDQIASVAFPSRKAVSRNFIAQLCFCSRSACAKTVTFAFETRR